MWSPRMIHARIGARTGLKKNTREAVKGEAKLSSPLDYAHVLTEVVQLGNLASRTGADIIWDSKNLVCKGNPKATAFVNPPKRSGWF